MALKENKLLISMFGIALAIAFGAIVYAASLGSQSNSRTNDQMNETLNTNETIAESVRMEAPTEETTPIIYYYTEDEVEILAKLLYSECRGVPSTTRKACVAWVVCNRVDTGEYDSVYDAIISPGQFSWSDYNPVTTELYEIALDVLTRWNREKNGETGVGRVIPKDYLWFHGENGENYFRNRYNGNFDTWDYSLPSPYDN